MSILPLGMITRPLRALENFTDSWSPTPRMPVLFFGHGSPMNAIEENVFVKGFRETASLLPRPRAVLCVSAHWETNGTFVTAMQQPRTIHDFGGFPPELYAVRYPAPGSPDLAIACTELIRTTTVEPDHHWGLDHGAWSVIRHLFPKADIPVIQLSLDQRMPAHRHYSLAKELSSLREKGVLIVGSGNMVHNLRLVAWDKLNEAGFGFDWAIEAQELMRNLINGKNHQALCDYHKLGNAVQMAIPTPEHYLPLLYVLAQQKDTDVIRLFNDMPVAGALTMTSLMISAS